MSMCWWGQFSVRRSLQFRECTFSASSVLSGSANAFLTLRVGMITKEYGRCTVRLRRRVYVEPPRESCEGCWAPCPGGTVKLSMPTCEGFDMKTESSVPSRNRAAWEGGNLLVSRTVE